MIYARKWNVIEVLMHLSAISTVWFGSNFLVRMIIGDEYVLQLLIAVVSFLALTVFRSDWKGIARTKEARMKDPSSNANLLNRCHKSYERLFWFAIIFVLTSLSALVIAYLVRDITWFYSFLIWVAILSFVASQIAISLVASYATGIQTILIKVKLLGTAEADKCRKELTSKKWLGLSEDKILFFAIVMAVIFLVPFLIVIATGIFQPVPAWLPIALFVGSVPWLVIAAKANDEVKYLA